MCRRYLPHPCLRALQKEIVVVSFVFKRAIRVQNKASNYNQNNIGAKMLSEIVNEAQAKLGFKDDFGTEKQEYGQLIAESWRQLSSNNK